MFEIFDKYPVNGLIIIVGETYLFDTPYHTWNGAVTYRDVDFEKGILIMNRCEKAVEYHKKGCNCAQAVACVFADKLGYSEDELFRLTEAFGGGMGGTQGVCGAVSGMVFVAGGVRSYGMDKLPETNKKESYAFAHELMGKFRCKIGTIMCSEIKSGQLHSCDGCIEDAVRILEEYLGE